MIKQRDKCDGTKSGTFPHPKMPKACDKTSLKSGDLCNNLKNKYVFLEMNKEKNYPIRKKWTTNENIFQINGEYSQEIEKDAKLTRDQENSNQSHQDIFYYELAEIKNKNTKFVGWQISNASLKMLLISF